MTLSHAAMVTQTVMIGAGYIITSSALISFNKYLMKPDRFPHAQALACVHMSMTTLLSLLLSKLVPSIYPSMGMARENVRSLLKYIAPLACCFAISLCCSNAAYEYSTVAFLQFCKEGNIALVFVLSCLLGLQVFNWYKVAVLTIVLIGCSVCANGEIKFVWMGFLLQITSQFAEVSKNLIGEVVMTGAGLKLDALTFVSFQAPCSLIPLLVAFSASYSPDVLASFARVWPLILLNGLVAFCLNVMIALTLKKLSTVAFVIIGLLKDVFIVTSSSLVFGDRVSLQQRAGFTITILGIILWSALKVQEQEASRKSSKETAKSADEVEPLVAKGGEARETA